MNSERTTAFFLANLGSEVQRLQSALAQHDAELAEGALKRARAIFAALAQMPLRPAEGKEIEILRDVVEDVANGSYRFGVNIESLESYFYPFARKVLGV